MLSIHFIMPSDEFHAFSWKKIVHSSGKPSRSFLYRFANKPFGAALKITTGGSFVPSAAQHNMTVALVLLALVARILTCFCPFLAIL